MGVSYKKNGDGVNLLNTAIYHGISFFILCLGVLPLSVTDRAGNFLAALWFAIDRKHRQITSDNIRHAYGSQLSSQQQRNIARAVFKNTVGMLFEHARFRRIHPGNYSRFLSIRGLVNLTMARARGKGVLCFSAHLGNWELVPTIGSLVDIPISIVYRKLKFSPLDRYVKERRSATGCRMLTMHRALDEVMASLTRGEVAGMIIDQNTSNRRHGAFVNFFGRKACANTGPAMLALSTDASVLPIFTFRENGKFIIEILPQVPTVRTGDYPTDLVENTRIYNAIIETYVKKYPEQWFWVHNRWRTRPVNENKILS